MEKWESIIGYEDIYYISNKGNVKSKDRTTINGRKIKGIAMKTTINKNGYSMISLNKDGFRTIKYIHRLVAEAFIENIDSLREVNHKDENKLNNRFDNLEWCTSKYNANYGTRNKRQKEKLEKKTLNITNGNVYDSAKKASIETGVDYSTIVNCCNNKRGAKTAGGFCWRYI